MKKAIRKRIKITKNGKIKRRAGGLGHSKSNKNSNQLLRKKGGRGLDLPTRVIRKNITYHLARELCSLETLGFWRSLSAFWRIAHCFSTRKNT